MRACSTPHENPYPVIRQCTDPDCAGRVPAGEVALSIAGAHGTVAMHEGDPQPPHAVDLRQLAHDLRNCLATLKSATHLLNKAGARPHLLPQIRESVERAVDRMAALIDTGLAPDAPATPGFTATQGPTQTTPDAPVALRRILIADDNRDAATSLAMILGLEGYEVIIAHDGNEALLLAQSKQPDILLLDFQMPLKDGAQVAREIRRQPWAHNRTLIAITGWSCQVDEAAMTAAGFDAQLRKPVDIDALMRLL